MKFLSFIVCISMQLYLVSSKPLLSPKLCTDALTVETYTSCVLNLLTKAKNQIVMGVPELNIQPLDPLKIQELRPNPELEKLFNFSSSLNNIAVRGLSKLEFQNFKLDQEARKASIQFYLPSLSFKTGYALKANLFQRIVDGKGEAEINLKNIQVKVTTTYKAVMKAGVDYIQMEDLSFKFLVGDGHAKIVSSDPERQVLANLVVQIINANPQSALSQMYDGFGVIFDTLFKETGNAILINIPANEFMPQQLLQ